MKTPKKRVTKPSATFDMRCGVDLITEERLRQINEEGYTAAHDDVHTNDEIVLAAATYALPARITDMEIWDASLEDRLWPWPGAFNPAQSRVRNLVKAGALIAAEIDRLLRIEARG